MDTFARRLLSIRRPRPLTTKTLTEKTWFSFAAQTWQSTCSAITSFNYELNIAAGGGPLSGSPTRSLEPLE
ncbi:Protein SMG9like [Caligus rogercresseyi]|uniref:Protein SMG9like n=1 Tax=Caligus rogercresseyi TaxID=217165 RepID=A0A7T8KJD9_CALRO|nr:Protein SMG9like [Caligus rogercresseyi]